MSLRPEFEDAALVQLNGLPPDAFDALVDRIATLTLEPWDAKPAAGELGWRWTPFGGGAGMLTFAVDEAAGVLRPSQCGPW
ncbi:MAG: hypothetical protein M3Y33_16305 [Actinomycetota bacterium]|nr:hypothetical protein [Actinomycetota bacterium]